MPKNKRKTHQATAKRLRLTGGKKKKFMKRTAGQDHFNSRERGTTTMGKRRDHQLHSTTAASVKQLLPYSKA
jgi:ribosomal protein L35